MVVSPRIKREASQMPESPEALETKVAFLEDTVANLDVALASQQRVLLALQDQVRLLYEQLKEQGIRNDGVGQEDEPPPPHY